jgi:hypothetical protein
MSTSHITRTLIGALCVWLLAAVGGGSALSGHSHPAILAQFPGVGFDRSTASAYANGTVTNSAPAVEFSADPSTGPAPLQVQFTDESTGDPTGWAWYFGDEDFAEPWIPEEPPGWPASKSVVLPDGSIVLAGSLHSEVWRSTDQGNTWTQMTASASWSGRNSHAIVALPDGSIVLMGGYDGSSYFNDVWCSVDQGATWTQVTASAEWTARSGHTSVALPDGSIVLMGGYDGSSRLNDVWRSTDQGATWTQMTASAEWTARSYHSSVVLPDGSIVLMGGYAPYSGKRDVWRSTDQGATWTLMTASAEWTARNYHASVALPDGSIVLTGGYTTAGSNDVWRSTDQGATWTQITASAEWSRRYDHASVALPDGSIVLMGGNGAIGNGDVWRSTDQGATWTQLSWWTARDYHTSVVLPGGSIVLIGGHYFHYDTRVIFNDVWRSTDQGTTWTQIAVKAEWTARYGHTSVVLPDGSIILMGGVYDYPGKYLNDVWRSTDQGATWTQVTANAGWSARTRHTSVVLPDGSIVLMGGYDYYANPRYRKDVWRSTDQGATWVQMTASAPWAGRHNHASVALPDGSIVLMGGYDGGNHRNDVWRSTDQGLTWTQMTARAEWVARNVHASVALPDGSIVLMGGYTGSALSKTVWRSTDQGATWVRLPSAGWTARGAHTSVVLPDGSIVLMGGHESIDTRNDVWRLETAASNEQHPSHTYTERGTYSVALQVYNADGYSSTRKPSYITVKTNIYLPLVLRNTP